MSQRCPLTLDMPTLTTLNKLVKLLSHPNLFNVEEVGFVAGRDQVLIVQPISRGGSLKDAIYKVGGKVRGRCGWGGQRSMVFMTCLGSGCGLVSSADLGSVK